MFNPTRDQVRRFLIEAWRKRREGLPAEPLETLAGDLIVQHPEYHIVLEDGEAALAREWMPEGGESNPFLHLSLHLAIEEQLSIDQPPGIRHLFGQLCTRHGERHAAAHQLIDCLAEAVWQAQRHGQPIDVTAYFDCLQQRAGNGIAR